MLYNTSMENPQQNSMQPQKGWYTRWHEGSHHKVVHWAGFIVVAVAAFFVLKNAFTTKPAEIPLTEVALASNTKQNTVDLSELTKKMLNAGNEHRTGRPEKADGALATLVANAKQRRSTLASLIKANPKAALEARLSASQAESVPQEAGDVLEHDVTLEGTVQELHADNFKANTTEQSYTLTDSKSGKRYTLYFAKPQYEILGGKKIKVSGIELDGNVAVATSQVVTTTSKSLAALSGPPAVRKVAVILFNFSNDPSQPYTKQGTKDAVFGAGSASVKSYYKENSYGLADIQGLIDPAGDVYGWYTIPMTNDDCFHNVYNWQAEANKLAIADGFVPSNYNTSIYFYPTAPTCQFGGMGSLGDGFIFLNGDMSQNVVSHELGHNYKVHHASAFQCFDDLGNQVSYSNNCNRLEYYDFSDTMGAGVHKHFNGHSKGLEMAGAPNYLAPENKVKVTADGTYVIKPIEKTSTGIQSLFIPKTFVYKDNFGVPQTVTDGGYFIDYRQPSGLDDFPPADPIVNGVTIRLAAAYTDILQTFLLDMAPFTGYQDTSLALNKSYTDTETGMIITVLALDANGATVRVTMPPTTCVRSNPTVTVKPSSVTGMPGETVTYTATIRNNDNVLCGASAFDLAATLPAGFTQSPDTVSEVITPGNSVVKTILVTSPVDATPGTYMVTEISHNVALPTYVGSGNASYVVPVQIMDSNPPVVTIKNPADGTTYTSDVTVKVTATASDADGIKTLSIDVDGKVLGTCTGVSTCTKNLLTKNLTIGTHTITATAIDKSGAKGTKSITVIKAKSGRK